MFLKTIIWLLCAWAVIQPAQAFQGKNKALEECRLLKSQIDRYTELRRKGGEATDMESWKRERGRAEQRFRAKRCRKFSHKI